ncbi:hypothetical protein GCM10022631_11050 [Deinococcus rubellus]|uniref:hypothetical protein n=1 Tax=Deinococcus rubellus TaxID=1889240 RepID=UPI0031E9FFB4
MLDIRTLLRFRALPADQRRTYEDMAGGDEAQDHLNGGHPWTAHRRELIAARHWIIQTGEHEKDSQPLRP